MPRKSYPKTIAQRNSLISATSKVSTDIPCESSRAQERQEDREAFCPIADAFATLNELSAYIPDSINHLVQDAFIEYISSFQWMQHPQTLRAVPPFIFAYADTKQHFGDVVEGSAIKESEVDIVRSAFCHSGLSSLVSGTTRVIEVKQKAPLSNVGHR